METPDEKRLRTCVGCGEQHDKLEMFRIVKTADGLVTFDATGRLAGRGAYVCSLDCLETAMKKNKIQKALRTNLNQGELDRITLEIVEALR